jgi:hypothetical protein
VSIVAQSAVILSLTPLAYIGFGIWLLIRKAWPIRAGVATLLIAALPIAWLFTLPPEETEDPGTGILLFMLLIPIAGSILLTLIGVALWIIRQFRPAGLRKAKQGVTT